jgi:hypothetical protein
VKGVGIMFEYFVRKYFSSVLAKALINKKPLKNL